MLWLDLTGIRPGSDAAILVQRLAPSLRARLGEELGLCRRDAGLEALGWDHLAALSQPPTDRTTRRGPGLVGRLNSVAARLPPRTRAAIRRFIRLLSEARRGPAQPVQTVSVMHTDTLRLAAGDTLLMLLPRGDASRFHAQDARLCTLLVDRVSLNRPDWLAQVEAEQLTLWHESTCGLVDRNLILQDIEPAGWSVMPAGATPRPGFILADGEIGLPGHTAQLLLAWRCLLERPGISPRLVLAGPLGPVSRDVLSQLANSGDFGGTVELFAEPTEAERAALRAACCFTVALETLPGWDRTVLDCRHQGVACLSAAEVDPTDASALAAALETWIHAPIPPLPPAARSWDDVARALIAALDA